MTWNGLTICAIALSTTLVSAQSTAETLPPIFANLPQSQDSDFIEMALADRVDSLPSDIRASTLRALLTLDGFEIEDTDAGVIASFLDAEFPCLTYYRLIWQETDVGKIEDLRAVRKRKCV